MRASFSRLASVFLALLAFPAYGDDSLKIGVEAFRDQYREPRDDIQVDTHTNYGSVEADYTHSWTQVFGEIQARGSYGKADYSSVSGTVNDTPQYETEARVLGGLRVNINGGSVILPYIGLGSRFYYDNSKGVTTDLGFKGYDRRILQFYVPIGASWKFTSRYGWTYTPNIEFDPLFLGKVNSRLGTIPGLTNVTNTQNSGYGWRGELMVGQQKQHYGWEVGPFIRYWNIHDSEVTTDPSGMSWVEPQNTRLQAGAKFRVTF